MGKYGLQIKNYEAASVYGYNIGIRDNMQETKAMLTNSLFLDFLLEIGLNVWKDKSTRDIVCLEFSYGSPSYEEELSIHKNKINDIKNDENIKNKDEKIKYHELMQSRATDNMDKFCKKSKNDLRTMCYKDGIDITYNTYNKKGEITKTEIIHYKMLYRTPGKAKKGTCMFICDELYNKAHEFLYMGIQLPEKNSPIVEVGAYASLITSSIVGKVQIKPEEILIIKDVNTICKTNVIKVLTDENRRCITKKDNNYELTSTIFDGQALIDSSIFPDWGNGYILLRHHFTKCAAFNTNIKKFMMDYYGEQYNTATVNDMFGRTINVKDIKLITTDNAIKWIKFGVDFDYWANWVRKNNCQFGIVKTAHKSKLGEVQRMSYQMINSLDLKSMKNITHTSVEYIEKLKSNDEFFLDYLRKESNFSNDYDALVALCEHNNDFVRSEYFRNRKKDIIKAYVLNFKSGRVIQNADNLTIVGSPYAMLLHSVGENPLNDPTFFTEGDSIQCWTSRFDDGEYLAEFRNPFNSRNNLGYMHNHYHEYFDRYFNLGKLCIAVNLIGTDFQARNNGSDQDSDSIYTTNQQDIVTHAKYCYSHYPTIVNEIKPEKNIYDLSLENYAKIDNELTAAQLAIGQSSNLAQLSLTYTYNFDDKKYYDYVCILSVLAQVAIDNAKRKYDVDLPAEISRINDDLDININKYPQFWQITKKDKRKASNEKQRVERIKKNKEKIKKKINKELVCPMNYLYDLDFTKYRNKTSTLPMKDFFIKHDLDENRRKCRKVEELIEKYSFDLYKFYTDNNDANWEDNDDILLLRDDYNELILDIKKTYVSKNYLGLMSWLLNRAFYIGDGAKRNKNNTDSLIDKNKSLLIGILFNINQEAFLKCFNKKVNT